MGISFKATATSAEPVTVGGEAIPDGIYDAEFLGVSVKPQVSGKYGTEDKYIWNFGLFGSDDIGETGKALFSDEADRVEVDSMTGQNMNTASKTVPGGVKVLKAILTAKEFNLFKDPDGGFEMKDEDLIGRKVELDIFTNEEGWLRIAEVRKGRGAK